MKRILIPVLAVTAFTFAAVSARAAATISAPGTLLAGGSTQLGTMSCVDGWCATTDFVTFPASDPHQARYFTVPGSASNFPTFTSCATSSLCIGVDKDSQFYDVNPTTGVVTEVGVSAQGSRGVPTSLACFSASLCTATGTSLSPFTGTGYAFTFDPTTGAFSAGLQVLSPEATACDSSTECTVTTFAGGIVAWNPQDPSSVPPYATPSSGTLIDPGQPLPALACPAAHQCIAIDAAGGELTFDPTNPGGTTRTLIDGGHEITALSCPSAGECIAVDTDGGEVTFSPAQPSAASRATVSTVPLASVSCPTPDQCVAGGNDQTGVVFDPSSPTGATPFTLGTQVASNPVPSNQFMYTKPTVSRNGTVRDRLTLPGPGKLVVQERWRGKLIARVTKTLSTKKLLNITLTPNRRTRNKIGATTPARLRLSIVFTPTGGTKRTTTLNLISRRARREARGRLRSAALHG